MTSSAALAIDQLWDHLEGEQGLEILFACEAGSRAWELASPDSDHDVDQVSDEPGDEVYDEIAQFIELLTANEVLL